VRRLSLSETGLVAQAKVSSPSEYSAVCVRGFVRIEVDVDQEILCHERVGSWMVVNM